MQESCRFIGGLYIGNSQPRIFGRRLGQAATAQAFTHVRSSTHTMPASIHENAAGMKVRFSLRPVVEKSIQSRRRKWCGYRWQGMLGGSHVPHNGG